MAEDEGFEPSIGFPIHAFQACALGRYANPPWLERKLASPRYRFRAKELPRTREGNRNEK